MARMNISVTGAECDPDAAMPASVRSCASGGEPYAVAITSGGNVMARVPYLEPSDLAPEDQDLLKRPIWLFKALVNSPKAARAFSGLGSYIRYGSKLDPRLRELAILQVGWLARSPYEWSHHVKLGHDFAAVLNATALRSQSRSASSEWVASATLRRFLRLKTRQRRQRPCGPL
jgi:alkylhydroperoxidase family enzyme